MSRIGDAIAYVRARRAVNREQAERRERALIQFGDGQQEQRGLLVEALIALAVLAAILSFIIGAPQ